MLQGEHPNTPVHKIPNLFLAKWGTHNVIRVLFPALYEEDRRKPGLTQEEQATFYEQGLRPAVVALTGASAAEWPPTYAAEMFRARGQQGTLAFQTKTLADWVVPELDPKIRECLVEAGVLWGISIQFLHQIRVVKASNTHSLSPVAASIALEELLAAHDLSMDTIASGRWWVDVGIEIASKEWRCLAWRTDSHFHVVSNVLELPPTTAARITAQGSSKYARDMTSHFTSVSGCRISPGLREQGQYEVAYFQMYTSDKSITYCPEGRYSAKHLTGREIIKGREDAYCHDLYELYRETVGLNYWLARIEVRVPLHHTSTVLIDIDASRFVRGLVQFEGAVWW